MNENDDFEYEVPLFRLEEGEKAGEIDGFHHSNYWCDVHRAKTSQEWREYEELLYSIRDAAEREAKITGLVPAPAATREIANYLNNANDPVSAVHAVQRYIEVATQFCDLQNGTAPVIMGSMRELMYDLETGGEQAG